MWGSFLLRMQPPLPTDMLTSKPSTIPLCMLFTCTSSASHVGVFLLRVQPPLALECSLQHILLVRPCRSSGSGSLALCARVCHCKRARLHALRPSKQAGRTGEWGM